MESHATTPTRFLFFAAFGDSASLGNGCAVTRDHHRRSSYSFPFFSLCPIVGILVLFPVFFVVRFRAAQVFHQRETPPIVFPRRVQRRRRRSRASRRRRRFRPANPDAPVSGDGGKTNRPSSSATGGPEIDGICMESSSDWVPTICLSTMHGVGAHPESEESLDHQRHLSVSPSIHQRPSSSRSRKSIETRVQSDPPSKYSNNIVADLSE